MSKTISGIDDGTFRDFRARAQKTVGNIGDALTETVSQWLDSTEEKVSVGQMDAFD